MFRDFFEITMICRSVEKMENDVETHVCDSFYLRGKKADAYHWKTAK